MIKMEVRGFCVQYTKRKNRERRNTEKHLQQQIDHLMNQLKTDRTKENISKLYRLRAEYNTIAEYRTKGAIIRSTIRWHKNGEKTLNIFWIWKKDNIVNHTFWSLKQTTTRKSTTLKQSYNKENCSIKTYIPRPTVEARIIHYSLRTQTLLNSKQLTKRNLSVRFSTESAFSS